ncbi:hypothetical protein MtrunA17_Chr7g0243981 [Medicago truncatula]|nr:hypothetical protein MtrunA17_Chr0c32g0494201 [Medicago truncatula]RHN46602.1 hypothetical protein MtrunA17_Chr7g0243981 [Medicago truncatula]
MILLWEQWLKKEDFILLMLVLLFMPSPNRYWLCATTVWICQHCIVSFGVVIFCTSVLFENSGMELVYCTRIPFKTL